MIDPSAGAVVLDLDGVLYLDREGVPGAADALARLGELGYRTLYATNNSTKTAETVATHIAERIGFTADPADAVTSAMAAAAHLRGEVETASVVGGAAIGDELRAVGITVVDLDHGPDAVVVGLDRGVTYDVIDRAARAVRAGARFVATNIDATYPTPDGLAPGAGTIVAAIATASGADPVSCGKPADAFGDLVQARIDHAPVGRGRIVMVGDRPETDIALGITRGWTTVLTLTGVTKSPDAVPERFRPDHVIDSIADLPRLLDRLGR